MAELAVGLSVRAEVEAVERERFATVPMLEMELARPMLDDAVALLGGQGARSAPSSRGMATGAAGPEGPNPTSTT